MLSTVLAASVLFVQQKPELPAGRIALDGLLTTEGKAVQLPQDKRDLTVFLFLAHDCPVANRYAPEIKRIFADYGQKGVSFGRVYVCSMEDVDEVEAHTKEFGYEFPAFLDPELKFVKRTGVRVTPEAVVLSTSGKLLYRGRIDDQNIEHGRVREGYRRDLRLALDQALAGQPIEMPATAAVGCFIPGICD